MSVNTEAQRTLVKSPPELWNELSDAQSLASHLDGLKDVRIVRAESERTVEWQSQGASGSVRLEPSGFGTRVILSLTRDLPEEPTDATDQDATEQITAELQAADVGSTTSEPWTQIDDQPIFEPPATEPVTADSEPDHEPTRAEPQTAGSEPAEKRLGWLVRLFRRRPKQPFAPCSDRLTAPDSTLAVSETKLEPEPTTHTDTHTAPPAAWEPPAAAPEPPAAAPEPPAAAPEPPASALPATASALPATASAPPATASAFPSQAPTADLGAELRQLEARIAEQDAAMLTAMLDRLGAAHHRPFSRA